MGHLRVFDYCSWLMRCPKTEGVKTLTPPRFTGQSNKKRPLRLPPKSETRARLRGYLQTPATPSRQVSGRRGESHVSPPCARACPVCLRPFYPPVGSNSCRLPPYGGVRFNCPRGMKPPPPIPLSGVCCVDARVAAHVAAGALHFDGRVHIDRRSPPREK